MNKPSKLFSADSLNSKNISKFALPAGCLLGGIFCLYLIFQVLAFIWNTAAGMFRDDTKPPAETVAANHQNEDYVSEKEQQAHQTSGTRQTPARPVPQQTEITDGPSESEMLVAIRDRVIAINYNLPKFQRTRPSHGSPLNLALGLDQIPSSSSKLKIVEFRKLGAKKLQGNDGYLCTYSLKLDLDGANIDTSKTALFGPLEGEQCTARFTQVNGGWIWVSPWDEAR